MTVGIYVPLMVLQIFRWNYKPSAETKKTWPYRIFNFLASLSPLLAIITAARITYLLKTGAHATDFYVKNLSIVGAVKAGLNIGRIPRFRHPMGAFIIDVLPLTLIAFMESYSIARSMGEYTNTLHTLNASQEMVANGVANLCGVCSSAYPVSGSFSRSALVKYKLYIYVWVF
jgi:MFS superfamily sulfate permease-like transporter